ncbi:MAG: AAA family ATPase, partial [Bacteroidota bacterium]|nr:AAA family ATPase [Bacteroidota bacterium]
INGSGKSNFIKAIKLLYDSVIGNGFENTFLKEWSGFDLVANFSKSQSDYIKITYEFDKNAIKEGVENQGYNFFKNPIYEITIHRSGGTSYFLEEKIYSESKFKNKTPFNFLEMKNAKGSISTRESGKIGLQYYPQENNKITFKTQELVLRQISDPDRYYPLYTLKRAIEGLVVYEYFDTTLNSKIRQPGVFGTEERLLPNGENLAQILNRLKNRHTLHYEKIQDLIKKINPYFIDTSFDLLGSLLYLVLREEKLTRAVGAQHISDGSLRYLLLLTIFLNPENSGLLCIDEPEIGLHPDMTNTIADAAKDVASKSQIIIATHSPLLLNSFELNDLLIFEKNNKNSSIVSRKNEDDFEEWDDEFLVGQMWLRGELGGKRW